MMLTPIFALIFSVMTQQTAAEAPVPTQPQSQEGQGESVTVHAPPERRRVCRERGEDVGSNIRRRETVCLTREQLEAEQRRVVDARADLGRQAAADALRTAEPGTAYSAPVIEVPGPAPD